MLQRTATANKEDTPLVAQNVPTRKILHYDERLQKLVDLTSNIDNNDDRRFQDLTFARAFSIKNRLQVSEQSYKRQ